MLTGESLERFRGVIYRAEEPKEFLAVSRNAFSFWHVFIGAYVFNIPADYLISATFIGVFVHIVYLLDRWVIRQKR
jgi:hypothetical protein